MLNRNKIFNTVNRIRNITFIYTINHFNRYLCEENYKNVLSKLIIFIHRSYTYVLLPTVGLIIGLIIGLLMTLIYTNVFTHLVATSDDKSSKEDLIS